MRWSITDIPLCFKTKCCPYFIKVNGNCPHHPAYFVRKRLTIYDKANAVILPQGKRERSRQMRCGCNAEIARWQICHSMIGKFTFIASGLTVSNLEDIWIELLGPHRFIRFKIEEAKLYALKQAIIFYDTTPITSIIHNQLSFASR